MNKYLAFAECYINQLVEDKNYTKLKAILIAEELTIDDLLDDSLVSNEFRNEFIMYFNTNPYKTN